jgi:hypothetical protein
LDKLLKIFERNENQAIFSKLLMVLRSRARNKLKKTAKLIILSNIERAGLLKK